MQSTNKKMHVSNTNVAIYRQTRARYTCISRAKLAGITQKKKQTKTKQQQMKLQTSDLKKVNNGEDSRHDEG